MLYWCSHPCAYTRFYISLKCPVAWKLQQVLQYCFFTFLMHYCADIKWILLFIIKLWLKWQCLLCWFYISLKCSVAWKLQPVTLTFQWKWPAVTCNLWLCWKHWICHGKQMSLYHCYSCMSVLKILKLEMSLKRTYITDLWVGRTGKPVHSVYCVLFSVCYSLLCNSILHMFQCLCLIVYSITKEHNVHVNTGNDSSVCNTTVMLSIVMKRHITISTN